MANLVTVSLFSGCGGGDIGATRAGAEIIFANDISPNAVATYKKYKHLHTTSDAQIRLGDITKLKTVPKCDLLIGCYPCQAFSMGGPRRPDGVSKAQLYLQFKRVLEICDAKYFVVENVGGLVWLAGGKYLKEHVKAFEEAGKGYTVTSRLVNAKDYGVPAERKRVFMVGIRKDLGLRYEFPLPTHGPMSPGMQQWVSHGDAILGLSVDADGEWYDYAKEPFPWWYLSRNRKRRWEEPSYTISGNWRHVPLHPASPTMMLVESNLSDGSKQRWEFTGDYNHLEDHPERPKLDRPRRLSWRECAAIQTFPSDFEPCGSVQSKQWQIGNAVPPMLMEAIVRGIADGSGLCDKDEGSQGHFFKASG